MQKSVRSGPIITRSSDPWEDYLSLAVKREYKTNVTLLYPGQKNDYLYYVKKGEVLVSHFASPETINKLFILRENAMLGVIGLFTPVSPLASWLTLTPTTCWLFSRECVENQIPRNLLLNLLEQLALMSSCMTQRFFAGAVKRNEVRLARLLLHLSDACPVTEHGYHTVTVIPNVTQEMAGSLLGMHHVTLNKLLAQFRALGFIGKFTKNTLEILDSDALNSIAENKMALPVR